MPRTLDEFAVGAGLERVGAPANAPLAGFAISTSGLAAGQAFCALQGRSSHGVQFAEQAAEHGAAALFVGADADDAAVARAAELLPTYRFGGGGSWVLMAALARHLRLRRKPIVVAITGSTGKTSTKDLLAAMVGAHVPVHASAGNQNNEIGVPLTLLQAPAGSQVVICEMGMRGVGQIAYLCDIAEPDVGIITNAGPVHLEMVGGTLEGVVAAKAELASGVRHHGAIVLPAAQPELAGAAASLPERLWWFGPSDADDPGSDERFACIRSLQANVDGMHGEVCTRGDDGPARCDGFDVHLHGRHHAANIAAAAAAAREVERQLLVRAAAQPENPDRWDLGPGLSRFRQTAGRGDRYHLPGGGILLDSTYNANPDSMRAALAELAEIEPPGRRVAVLGEMAELGEASDQHHADLGMAAAAHDIDVLVVVGTGTGAERLAAAWNSERASPCRRFDDASACNRADDWWKPGDAVLIKASNAAGLSRIVEAMRHAEARA